MEYATPEDILRDADTAMYRAKAEGRGRFEVFDITMRSTAVARMQVQSDLREAIENGDLMVHYQPVLALRDLRIRGFEALVRWQHPTRGMVAPPEFINVAEETGLIIPLGELVLRSVCKLLRKWKDARLPLAWVAVNLSAHQFEVRDLVQGILSTIDDIGAPAERVQFEITEGTAAANPERAVIMLQELRERGIKVALDDFGTGYSSMAYLKRFPIDALKLDRSFVKDLPESHDDAAIATSIIAMAQSLGLKTVAEGVENERQAMFLKSHGCDEVQGFLYARPMCEDDATALLKKGFGGTHQPAP
jgi:EAL domain-containing protein (putative c-di-GMP-specific phosphodiesterase class I)